MSSPEWSAAEHEKFIEALEAHGGGKTGAEWQRITEHIGTRSIPEVWQHAEKYLVRLQDGGSGNVAASKPKINSGEWTWEENMIFEDALASTGESADRWRKISRLIPGKTPAAVQKHYQLLVYDITRIEAGEIAKRAYIERRSEAEGGRQVQRRKKHKS